MLWLILSVLLNTYIGLVFKVYSRFGISNLQVIAFNYWICAITGAIFLGYIPTNEALLQKQYWHWSLINGLSYFIVFISIGTCTLLAGVSATQTANKLSLVIPVAVAILLYGEGATLTKLLGMALAVIAVILSAHKESGSLDIKASGKAFGLIAFIFIGSGLLDSLSNYIQRTYLQATEDANLYLIGTFTSGAIFSTIWLLYQVAQKKEKIELKNFIGAVVLGIPNYFSIYSLIAALKSKVLPSSSLIPVNNIAVVLVSTICAILFFREKLSRINFIGLGLALLSIVILYLAGKC